MLTRGAPCHPDAWPVELWRGIGEDAAMELRFYYDVVCPYAYLASTQIEAVAARHGATVKWVPVLLGGIFKTLESPQQPAAQMSAPRARLNLLDMHRWAEHWDVPLKMPAGHPRRSVQAMRMLIAAPDETRAALTHAFFAAYWRYGEDLSNREVVERIAFQHGVPSSALDDAEVKQGLFDSTAEAVEKGAFGVPCFSIPDLDRRPGSSPKAEGGEHFYWGQDRLHFVEAALGRPRHTGPLPRIKHGVGRQGSGAKVRFFHDFSSPFSYLGSTQIERVCAGAGATLEYAPILLGGLFREIGTADVPLLTFSEAKQRYQGKDLNDWAKWWGVPFHFPKAFPLRTIAPLRVAIAEPEATPLLYLAAWAKDQNIGDPAVLKAVLDEGGYDGEALLQRTQEPEVKATLRANTEAAKAAGACGVPSFEVTLPGQPPVLFWGQDRLDFVARALDGWRPQDAL